MKASQAPMRSIRCWSSGRGRGADCDAADDQTHTDRFLPGQVFAENQSRGQQHEDEGHAGERVGVAERNLL